MSDIVQQTIFVDSGLDTDTDIRYIGLGDSPWRLNVLIGEDGATGVITLMRGNIRTVDMADHELLVSNHYSTIASYYNRLTRKVYYLVWSHPYALLHYGIPPEADDYVYDNKLFCYNEDANTLDLIFTDTKNYFGFELNYPVRDLSMLGDLLYFNTRVSEPKVIDVVRAYNYTNYLAYDPFETYVYGNQRTYAGGLFQATGDVGAGQTPVANVSLWNRIGDSYMDETDLDFNSEFDYAFNVLRMPPTVRPVVSYRSDTDKNTNNVRGKVFRFSYRYKYFDNSYSAYSAFSDITLPEDDEVYNGEILNTVSENNYLQVLIYPHSPALVKEIEIVYQEISGDWKRVKVINRQQQEELDTKNMYFDFYNNESYIQVPNIEVAKIIDYVPKRANSQELINKNILCYGGCLEGFDNLPKDELRVGLTPICETITVDSMAGVTIRNNLTSGDITIEYGPHGEEGYVWLRIGTWWNGGVGNGDLYIITLDGVTAQHTVTAVEAGSKVIFIDNLLVFLNNAYHNYNFGHKVGDADYIAILHKGGIPIAADITQSLFCTNGGAKSELTKKKGFKTGANHPFCIFYYDENMRRWDAQTSKDNIHVSGLEIHGTTAYVPMFNDLNPLPVPDTTAHRFVIDWEVYHLPPEGAKYWRWGYSGNSLCNKMVQYMVNAIDDTVSTVDGANMIKIDITPLQTLKSTITSPWNQFPSSVIDPYAWQPGDRVRFITKVFAPGAGTELGDLVDGVFDFEILKQDGDSDEYIYIAGDVATNGLTAASIGGNSLIEIYSPLKSLTDTKTIFYEFGNLMPIITDSVGVPVHAGQDGIHNQDTALCSTASGTFDGGDIYHIMRTPSKPLDTATPSKGAFHESMWYSDFYDSDDYDRGKIGFETNFGERFLNLIRYSRPFFQNTLINGLSTFEEDNANGWPGLKELNDVYGNIVAILEMGDTLKVYQERKASSILVGRTEYMDASGNPQVMTSNVVLGAIRYSPSNYSTIYTESISRNNKFLYGFDVHNGVVWRDSVNGIFPISGRYAEAGGDADYKMQTYFKLKSKALMHSGVENTSVLTVWDEEFKNLYVTFKDRVDANNDDTVVFHEPSNRWICFTEFNTTPEEGYNIPLEPTYEIVRGFLGGLGYTWDEETRFSHFDFETQDIPVVVEPDYTYIVDEDGTTYIVDEDGETFIIE